jgi:hypothetical protein
MRSAVQTIIGGRTAGIPALVELLEIQQFNPQM